MELKVSEVKLPSQISFNYEELKTELTERIKIYETMVYGDDQIKQAKADRADLNKLKRALNDERIRLEREYMAPFNEFKLKINEIIAIVDKPAAIIDRRVKEFEQAKKEEKKAKIKEMFEEAGLPEYITFDKIFDPDWLKASIALSTVGECIRDIQYRHDKDIETLSALPEFGFEAVEVYKQTLDMNRAIAEAQRMSQIAKAKAEAESKEAELAKQKAEPQQEEPFPAPAPAAKEPVRMWISFTANLSKDDAVALRQFFMNRNIAFKAI